MPERLYTVYCEHGPSFRIDADGLVHIEDKTGGILIHRVMSVPTFRKSLQRAEVLLAEWIMDRQNATSEPVSLAAERKKRKGKSTDHAAS
jgi:hypothetical protein